MTCVRIDRRNIELLRVDGARHFRHKGDQLPRFSLSPISQSGNRTIPIPPSAAMSSDSALLDVISGATG
jgi:hypothetical protein